MFIASEDLSCQSSWRKPNICARYTFYPKFYLFCLQTKCWMQINLSTLQSLSKTCSKNCSLLSKFQYMCNLNNRLVVYCFRSSMYIVARLSRYFVSIRLICFSRDFAKWQVMKKPAPLVALKTITCSLQGLKVTEISPGDMNISESLFWLNFHIVFEN